MKLINLVDEIFLGKNNIKTKNISNYSMYEYKLLNSSAIRNRFVNADYLDVFDSPLEIDKKFFTKTGDIIISSKQPYNVVLISQDDTDILVPNNFIILRGININHDYLYNYLNLIGQKMKQNENDENSNITKTDIEELEIEIDKNMVEKISKITSKINIRQKAYGKLLDNDQELIRLIFEKGGCIFDE